jgi:hypothetical protein
MPPTPAPLWPGYGDDGEQSLIELLKAKVAATLDEDDPTDEVATRDFAAAIESHEWLRHGSPGHFSELQDYARHIRVTADAGSWRR